MNKILKNLLFVFVAIGLSSCMNAGKKGTQSISYKYGEKIAKLAGKDITKDNMAEMAQKKAEKTFIKSFSNMNKNVHVAKLKNGFISIKYSPVLLKAIDNEVVLSIFQKAKYTERTVVVRGRKVPLLVSPKFKPNLTVPKDFYGSYDVVKYHKGNPLYVVDGCETNLGRMKRGMSPVYYDPDRVNPTEGWGHYFPLELHHGGQKKAPAYFALMGEEHKVYSKELHTKRIGSEINRNEFGQKERAPLYMDIANEIANSLK